MPTTREQDDAATPAGTPAPTLAHRLEDLGLRLGSLAVHRLPLRLVHGIATGIASGLFMLRGRRVGWTLANLRIAFPEKSEEEREQIGRASFRNFALSLVDVLSLRDWSESDLLERVEVAGTDNLDEALARGKGAILLGLHVGSFELGGAAAPALTGKPVAWVSRPLKNPLADRRFDALMTRRGGELIPPRGAAAQMLRRLRKGGMVGLLNDQYVRRSHGIFVPFFGVRCSTSPGVALVALRSGAPVLLTYMRRLGPDRHVATIAPPISFDSTGDRKTDVEQAATALNAAYEAIIRANPTQYLWSSRRFRHSPDLPANPYR